MQKKTQNRCMNNSRLMIDRRFDDRHRGGCSGERMSSLSLRCQKAGLTSDVLKDVLIMVQRFCNTIENATQMTREWTGGVDMFFKSSDEEGELHAVRELGAQKKTDE